ncbi:MAG: type II secretion system protein [Betaproteobacteria bacterium]|nr:type II secretion system protein [Betaproteobacteria bacterium]
MRAKGFTLVELITVIVILAILAAVAVPRIFGGSAFESLGFTDETVAALRYAQKSAMAMQRTVCVNFTATSIELRFDPTDPPAVGTNCLSPAGDPLSPPAGGTAPYQVTARGSAGFSPTPTSFRYDRLGRPVDGSGNPLASNQTIAIAGARSITVEVETGYVH